MFHLSWEKQINEQTLQKPLFAAKIMADNT